MPSQQQENLRERHDLRRQVSSKYRNYEGNIGVNDMLKLEPA
ncbi:hypothetical protein [Methanobrevibacter sp.]